MASDDERSFRLFQQLALIYLPDGYPVHPLSAVATRRGRDTSLALIRHIPITNTNVRFGSEADSLKVGPLRLL